MFSVVIPLYNKSQTICRCLNSVLSQTFVAFEVLIVNDGSTDDSIDVIKREFSDERIVFVEKKNGGVSSARNEGLSHAKYNWVAFIDADDTWNSEYLEKMSLIIKQNSDIAIYGCRQNFLYPNGKISISYYPDDSKIKIFNGEEYFCYAKNDIMFHASAIIVNKEILRTLGIKFDVNLIIGEDLEFYFQVAFRDKLLLYNDVLTNYYVDAPNSAMGKTCPLEKRLIGNIDRFFGKGDKKTTAQFFSEYILSCSKLLLTKYETRKEVLSILSLIDVNNLPLWKKIYYYMPNILKKYI